MNSAIEVKNKLIYALENLESYHVTENLFRMGLIGKENVQIATREIKRAIKLIEKEIKK
jgi:hypothetical protein